MFPKDTQFLLVDDVASMRNIARKILQGWGYRNCIEAENALLAFELLKEAHRKGTPIDVILSDWNMPNMTGLDLLKACRNDDKLKNIPFIMITAEGEEKNISDATEAGVSEYVIKPLTRDLLLAKLRSAFEKHNKKRVA